MMLKSMVWEHQAQIRMLTDLCNYLVQAHFAFRQRHSDLTEQVVAFGSCLYRSGVVSYQDLIMEMQGHRGLFCLSQLLNQPRVACGIALAAGLQTATCLLGCSRSIMGDIMKALSEVAADASAAAQGARAAEPQCAEENGFLELLQEVWHYSALADTVSCAMGIGTVQHFRAVSRAGRECMRSVHARILLWEPSLAGAMALNMGTNCAARPPAAKPKRDHRRAARQQRLPPAECLALLHAIWHDPALSEAIADATGPRWVRQFRAVSRSGRECIRASVVREPHRPPGDTRLSAAKPSRMRSEPLQRVLPEGLRRCSSSSPARAFDPPTKTPAPDVRLGSAVMLRDLTRKPELNGRVGKLVHVAVASGRWKVVLVTGESVRVKPANVTIVSSPEPCEQRPRDGSQRPAACLRSQGPRRNALSRLLAGGTPPVYRDVVEWRGLTVRIARHAGSVAVHALATTCKSLHGATGGQGKLYVCGGGDGQEVLSSMEFLDLRTGRWHAGPSMSRPRQGAASVFAPDCFYVCGGSDGHGVLNSSERFDPLTGEWQAIPPMLMPRIAACVGALAGCIYVCGGKYHVPLSSTERFDPRSCVWRQMPHMSQARAFAMAAVVNGRMVVIGGVDQGDVQGWQPPAGSDSALEAAYGLCRLHLQGSLASAESFDAASETWSPLPPMAFRRCAAALASTRQRIYICGGYDGADIRAAECFSAADSSWEILPPMLQARRNAVAAMAGGRRLFVCGGCKVGSVEAIDLPGGTWAELQQSSCLRQYHGFVACVAGQLYVCGGIGDRASLDAVERHDVAAQTWEPLQSMSKPRMLACGFHSLL